MIVEFNHIQQSCMNCLHLQREENDRTFTYCDFKGAIIFYDEGIESTQMDICLGWETYVTNYEEGT